MAEDFYKGKASMLEKGISPLSIAIRENARNVVSTLGNVANVAKDPVEAVKTVGDYISGGIGALDLANVINLNPVLAAGKGIYDISRMSEKYDQQKIDDLAKYGRETTGLGTFARSLPLVGGIASLFSGSTTRPDLNPAIRRYLAERGVDINDWTGGDQIGTRINPVTFNPATTPVTQAPLVAPDYDESTGTTSTGETYDWGDFYSKGGIASLSA